ncbi:hypothetical protein O181_084377 [Austropuccinia psidii MF-1]|uniref:Uncharacterized protein n=1 Tax=Austropuccinia psidii MF-1 TaxID=1389203 RepID=A0A9Q3IKY3_9BASI|nr:hypothetical protein [Austropuccinia psidii MF-1]
MSEFMIHRKILRQCGGDLDQEVKSRTTVQSSAEDIINMLEEVTTGSKIGSSRVNLKTRFNTPWKDSVDKIPKKILIMLNINLQIQSESAIFAKAPPI